MLLDLGFSLDAGARDHDPAQGNRLVLQTQWRRICEVLQTLGERTGANTEKGALQITLGIKERNAGKLDTHAWVFWGLCERLNPEFMLQVDVGTVPADDCVASLLEHMAAEPGCAALATNTLLDAPTLHKIGLTWQYGDFLWEKISDWPIGHLLGYIEVIPGQCSMVRWAALRENAPGPENKREAAVPPVDRYLRGVESQNSLLERNLFLAEDRVIALEILKERGSAATIRHASLSGSETDPCTNFAELLHQRRRWINSTTVARLSALCALPAVLIDRRRSGFRRAEIGVAMLSIFLQLMGQTVLPSLVAVCFSIGARQLAALCGYDPAPNFRTVVAMSFLLAWALVVILARELKPTTALASSLHQSAAILLSATVALIMIPFIGALPLFGIILVTMVTILVSTLLILNSRSKLQDIIRILFIYLPLLPSISLYLTTYAYANLSDTSWGTKGLTGIELESRTLRRWGLLRDSLLVGWVALNFLLTWTVVSFPVGMVAVGLYAVPCLFLVRTSVGLSLSIASSLRRRRWNAVNKPFIGLVGASEAGVIP